MSIKPLGNDDRIEFVNNLVEGNPEAAARLELERPILERLLVSLKATPADATEIVGNVLGECCKPDGRLSKYRGIGPVNSYLKTIVRRAWIDWVRRDSKLSSLPENYDAAGDPEARDDEVVAILKESLLEAFAEADPESLLILRLVHEHKLKQQDLIHAWACSAAKVSRKASSTIEKLRARTLANVRKREPNLDLEWEDFKALCADSNVLFGDRSDDTVGSPTQNLQESES